MSDTHLPCFDISETYWTNPQFRIDVKDPDPEDDDNSCRVVIALMQKDMRMKSNAFLTIGFMLYEVSRKEECNTYPPFP